MKQVRFRPRESDRKILDSLMEASGLDQTAVIRFAIRKLATAMKESGWPVIAVDDHARTPKKQS